MFYKGRHGKPDCRSPYGERGLKYLVGFQKSDVLRGRSPYGERGLKYPPPTLTLRGGRVTLLTESVD